MSLATRQQTSFRQALVALCDRRFLAVFFFGFCSGFPWVLHGSVLTLWMQQSGLSRSAIGYIGAVATVYAANWLWAPFVDRLRLPLLSKRLGQRRAWILFCQFGICLSLLGLSFGDPQQGLAWISVWALGIAVFSATMDIAVDAYRITLFAPEEMDSKMPYAAAMSTTGWFAGYGFLGGAVVLALGGESIGLAWTTVYQLVAVFYLLLIALIALMPQALSTGNTVVATSAAGWLKHTVVDPFTEFFRRCGLSLGFGILLFLVIFRLGEAMLGRMSLVFYVELGFTTDQISFYQKFFGGLVTAGFSLLGAFINTKFGVIRGLFVAGVAMAAANLLFALLAIVGPNPQLFVVALLVDNFFQAFATVASVAFISYFTSRTFTGTQYALMASISNFGRTTLAAGSGAVVDFLGGQWALFFVLTTLMVIPGLLILLWLGRALSRREMGSGSMAGN